MVVTPRIQWEGLSLTPRLIAVQATGSVALNGFNRFPSRRKETVKTVSRGRAAWLTAMNRGVNENRPDEQPLTAYA